MIAKGLGLHNYYSHTNTELVFDKEVYLICGAKILDLGKSNGSGKTTIIKAMEYAVYGDASDDEAKGSRSLKVKGDDLIYNDAKEAEVDFKFEVGNNDYRIRRVLRRGGTASIYISKNDGEETKYGVKAGQEIIDKIVGASHKIFKNTSYFQQGDLNSFSKLTPKSAKDVVIKILQLDIYNEYEQEAKGKASLIQGEIGELEGNLEVVKELIEQQQLKEEDKEIKFTKKDLNEIEEAIKELKFHDQLQKFWENSKDKHIDFIDDYRLKVQQVVSKVNAEIGLVEQRVRKMEGLSGVKTCPTCEQSLKEEDIAGIVKVLKDDIDKRSPKRKKYQEALTRLDTAKSQIRSYTISLYDNDAYIQAKEKSAEIRIELKKVKEDKSKLKELLAKSTKIKLGLKQKKDLLAKYVHLQKAFGRNGIQAYIIENVIPEIEVTANDILKGLDTAIRISIESQKDLKKGGKAETLDINVITEYGERPYANYSGGEKTFIDFALRMALAIILARRSNCQIQTLILDEVFGELDSVNKQIIAKAIKYIAKKFDFKRIFVISHAEELQDTCKNIIRVLFDGKKSYVK